MTHRFSKFARLINRILYVSSAAMLLTALVLSVSVHPAAATANPGSIWTTDGSCGTSSQDVNHYDVGGHVYINFSNFTPGTYAWQIQQVSGNPKPIVASGNYTVGASGAGCFDAHTVQQDENGLEYSVDFGTKNDNYQVNRYVVPTTPVPTENPTETVTPTQEPTDEPTETITPTEVPTDEPTETVAPTEVPTDEPTETIAPTEVPTDEPTETVAPTEVPTDEPTETVAPTEVPTDAPTDVPTEVVTETPSSHPVSLKPLSLAIDPFCTTDGQIQWTVENPNNVKITLYSYTVDGNSHSGFSVKPGSNSLTTTALGTHTVVISYGEGQTESSSQTLNVCPLPIPVTGSTLLIPVTGADQSNQLSGGFLMAGISFSGLGLVLSSLRKLLDK